MIPPTHQPAPPPRARLRAEDRAVLSVVGALTLAFVAAGFAVGGVLAGALVLAAVVVLVGVGATLLHGTPWAWATGRTAAGVVATGAVFGLLLGGLAAPRTPLQPTSATVPTVPPASSSTATP